MPTPMGSPTALFGKKEARAQGNERKNKTERVKKQKDDVIEVEGVVIESLPNAMFRCTIDGAPETQPPVLATISGKIRKNFVKILVGDKVLIELVRTFLVPDCCRWRWHLNAWLYLTFFRYVYRCRVLTTLHEGVLPSGIVK